MKMLGIQETETSPHEKKMVINAKDRTFMLLHSPQIIGFRLRTPRLLVKVVNGRKRRRRSRHGSNDAAERKKSWSESGGNLLVPVKTGSVFCSTFFSRNQAADEEKLGKSKSIKNILEFKGENRTKADIQCRESLEKSNKSTHYLFLSRTGKNGGGSSAKEPIFCFRFSGLLGWKKRLRFSFRKWRITGGIGTSCMGMAGLAAQRRNRGYYTQIQSIRSPEEADEEEEKEEGIELCKKRILMGDRCKPLSISGRLNYDQNGVLLPELLPYD
ncbi:unnamed protein product [Cuscuta epithymum]|uniref:Uncharacterized protein n=1 Tax=Cuscuta epithymum TaxID=186058 RepID=A0AAV0CEF0_9ASTE|nr:unnamed protein product [Cuscuta epithymum]